MTFNQIKSWTGASAAAALLLYAVYLVRLEPSYLTYTNVPFPVVGDVQRGEGVPLLVKRCSTSDGPRVYIISRQLIRLDAKQPPMLLQASGAGIEPGCGETISKANVIPKDTPPGVYIVQGYAETNGTIRSTVQAWRSQRFTVQ